MRTKNTFCKSTVVVLFIITSQTLMVQKQQRPLAIVQKNADAIGQFNDDLNNACVSDSYTDVLSDAALVYVQQTYKGINPYKSMQGLAFKNETLASFAGRRPDLNAVKGAFFIMSL
jgi:hypothetical protein